MKNVALAIAAVAFSSAVAAPAFASCSGFIANLAHDCDLDKLNRDLNHPLERIVGGVIEQFIPGAGWVYVRMAPGVNGG